MNKEIERQYEYSHPDLVKIKGSRELTVHTQISKTIRN